MQLLSRFVPFALTAVIGSALFGQGADEVFDDLEPSWLERENGTGEAAEAEHLETDRDSFTPATTTVNKGRTIFESAYSYLDNRNIAETHSLPEIVTRYGLTDRIELRLGWNWEAGGGGSVSGGDPGGGLEELGLREESQMLYGVKLLVTEQESWLPQSSCIIQGATPTSGPETATDFLVGYVLGYRFFDDWQLDSSLRYNATKEEGDHHNQWAPSVVLKVPVHERWNVHGEYFGIFTDGKEAGRNPQYFSPGVHYLISPDFEVGVRVGWGLNDDAANFFSNVGIGVRF